MEAAKSHGSVTAMKAGVAFSVTRISTTVPIISLA